MTDSTSSWRPLLTGEAADQARQAVESIAVALQQAFPAASAEGAAAGRDLSLAAGRSGLALFFAYLHFAQPDGGYDEIAMTHLERAIEGTAELATGAGLYSGFSGVAWTLEHLSGRLFEADGEDPGEEIATILDEFLARSPWEGDYDLISGLVGFGIYALERAPRRGGAECLVHVLARLAEVSERRPDGISWHTPASRIGPFQAPLYPDGHYNLGMAHGVPGVIALLAEAPTAAGARPLLDGAMEWVLAQRLPPPAKSFFSYNFAVGHEAKESRLAWCYGDLGVAVSLLAAARAVAPAETPLAARWEEAALEVARGASARQLGESGVVDAGLCHGAAGVAHLFNRLYQKTGDGALRAAAETWFAETLRQRSATLASGESGIGGFRAWLPDVARPESTDLYWVDDPGFLTGAAGIGLALLAATTPVEPEWDRVLLSSLRRPATLR